MARVRLPCVLVCALTLFACEDEGGRRADDGTDSGAGMRDSGSDEDEDAGLDGRDSGSGEHEDAGPDGQDAGSDGAVDPPDAGPTVHFDVPTNGGTLSVPLGDVMVSFKFPASAGGKAIAVTPAEATDANLPDESLAGLMKFVLDLQPDGTTFDDPIEVAFSDGSLIAFSVTSDGKFTPLPLAPSGKALLLSHFSHLVVPLDSELCESSSGWVEYADSPRCTEVGAATTYRQFSCKNYRFCYVMSASCCVDPTSSSNVDDGCSLGSPSLSVSFIRTGSNGGQYPYCDEGLPKLTSLSGTLEATGADQEITLTGTDFHPEGSVFIDGDVLIPTTWNSATSVTAVVSGARLGSAGTLSGVGYVNPTYNATGPCAVASSGNCDWGNRSNMQSLTIAAVGGGDDLPVIDSIQGTLVANGQDQVITVKGLNFDPQGSVFIWTDVLIETTWVSATEVTAVIPGLSSSVDKVGNVGYVNPTSNAAGPCNAQNPGNCDWAKASNTLDLTVSPEAPSCFMGGSPAEGVTGSGSCDDPFVIDLRNADIGQIVYHATAEGADEGGVPWNDAPQCGVAATARDVVYKVLLPPGADLEAAVEASPVADPVIFVHEDESCLQPINACADDHAEGGCEMVAATHHNGVIFGQAPYITVSEVEASGTVLATYFRLTGSITLPAAAKPVVTSITPSLVANGQEQTITLHGSNFTPNGSAFMWMDVFLETTFVSDTEVRATVPGGNLTVAGTLGQVGFVNATSGAAGPCGPGNPGYCDWANRSNTFDLTIAASP